MAIKTLEEMLRLLNEDSNMNSLVEESPICHKIIDTDFNLRFMSKKGRDDLGIENIEEYYGSVFPPEFAPKETSKIINENLKRATIGETNTIEYHFNVDDNVVWYQTTITPFFNNENNLMYIRADSMNITESKITEVKLTESEEMFKSTLYDFLNGVIVHDIDSSIILSNPAAHSILGLNGDQLLGKKNIDPKWNFVNVNESVMKIKDYPVSIVLSSGEKCLNYVMGVKKPNIKEITWVNVNAVPKYKNNKMNGVIVNFEDITEIKKAEDEKKKAYEHSAEQDKLALVGKIAGKMAHDFNNVLAVIGGNAELTLMDLEEPPKTSRPINPKETLELICEQVLRGTDLTKNLVAFAKDQEPNFSYFRINDKVNQVINLLRSDLEEIEIITDYAYGVPKVMADPGMIQHALINLVQNSIHALGKTKRKQLTFKTYSYDKWISLEVNDNGCGIPKEHIQSILEPGFTLKGSKDLSSSYDSVIKGTGYGMSNVNKYIKQHNGLFTINSEVNIGTSVKLMFPIVEKTLSKTEIEMVSQGKIYSNKKILVLEDEPHISDVLYNILTYEPYCHDVDIVQNGKMAIDFINKNEYDLLHLDFVLPGGLSGKDVYETFRKTDLKTPVVFMSGNMEFMESIKKIKINDPYVEHIGKPCPNVKYVGIVNNMFLKVEKSNY
jgi:signal transduction histidine kinase